MNVLVTGGSGFLGSHVADALSDAGHNVKVFDAVESPYLRPDQEMIVGDLMNPKDLTRALRWVDAVYHFAAISDIDVCKARPVDTATVNIVGTAQLLEACVKGYVKRFVFASSAYVYSESGYFYRVSKQACEGYIETYHKLHGLNYTCIRYGSLYGTRAGPYNSIQRILTQALNEGKIDYSGTGDEIREFIHVLDAAKTSAELLDNEEYFNNNVVLSGSEKLRYRDLLTMIQEILNGEVEINMTPSTRSAHYKVTPYNFSPKIGKKYVRNSHIDMGQGLLHCLADIFENHIQGMKKVG